MAKTITIETNAWLTKWGTMDDVSSENNHARNIGLYLDGMESEGWTKIGKATLIIEVPDGDALIKGKVEVLRAEQAKIVAAAELASRNIEQQIQSLLAITCEATQ